MTALDSQPQAGNRLESRSPATSRWYQQARGRLGGTPGMTGLGILVVLIVVALAAPVVGGHSPVAIDPGRVLRSPSPGNLFGTDEFGRDVFTRVLFGLRTSLVVAIASVGLATLIGLPIGLIAGYFGGVSDMLLMRGIDLLLAFPALLLAIVMIAILGAGELVTVLAVGIIFVPIITRVVRSAVVVVRGHAYVAGARSRGASHWRVMMTHVVPNVLAPVIVQMSVLMGFAILIESSLAFLGLGVEPPTPDLGSMLAEGSNFASQAPWIEVCAGAVLAVTILAFNLTGRGLQRGLGVHDELVR
ncbi:MAG: ABC transporter permease [Streptosporangiaceae bacterium]